MKSTTYIKEVIKESRVIKMSMVLHAGGKPTPVAVLQEVFKDLGESDDVHWVLMENGTFYTFPKAEYGVSTTTTFSGDDLVAKALEMSESVHLLKYNDNDDVSVLPYQDMFTHPTYVVLSCLRQKIGWVIVADSKEWAVGDNQLAAVGYLARTKYEMDCSGNKIIAASFPWSAAEEDVEK